MKSLGIVRKVDELGRIVIPIETRRMLGIEEKDPFELYTENDMIILRKHVPGCMVPGCKEAGNVIEVQGLRICRQHAAVLVKAWENKSGTAR